MTAAPGSSRLPVVLQILPGLDSGGAERGAVDVAAAVAAAGGVALIASQGGRMVAELERCGGRHLTMASASKNPLTIARNALDLIRLIREQRVTVLHARSRAPAWSALLAARRTGVPLVTTVHGVYRSGNALKRLYNSVMTRGDRVIAISHYVADHLRATYPLNPLRLRVVQRGIDVSRFAPERVPPERIAALATAWGLQPGRPVVLMPARLSRIKGAAVLIEAIARLNRSDLYCLLIGDDQGRTGYRQELEAQVARLGLGDVVRMPGHCPDMAAAYLLADVVVSASTVPEGFGRTIVEAQAMGRPVIVTDLGPVAETVVRGETAWLIPPEDPAALAAALAESLALSPERRAALAVRAISHVAGYFTRERMCAETLAVYRELPGAWPMGGLD